MPLRVGDRLGAYEVLTPLGAGGMGAVYRARDSKLDRDVALKILPESFAGDPDRLMRFEREAKTLAALNHPHIAHIHGLEESGGTTALVMELVEGEDLSQRIARGAMPRDEALPIARQIADALEAAHAQGIIHRDLKPANIKVTADGKAKVLDFGLAKAAMAPPASVANSPTIVNVAGTSAGMILGTAAYMSPEQAKGRPVDKRTDIFAFGCVLFEMLTGKPAFDGDDVAEILSRVLQKEPDWTLLPAATPSGVRRLLALCLEKDRNRRRRDAGDILIDLDLALTEPAAAAAAHAPVVRKTALPWMLTAGAAAIAFGVLAVWHFGEQPPAGPAEMRLDIATPPTSNPLSFALSPDGRSIAFVATDSGESRLWVRRLDQTEAHSLRGTEGATSPFWSPDSKSIGFFVGEQLKRVEASGGPAINLSNMAASTSGGTWSSDGVIVFSEVGSAELRRVPASGGPKVNIPGGEGIRARWPEFLPDGRHLLFRGLFGGTITDSLYLGSLDGAAPKPLVPAETGAKWLAPDRVVYVPSGQRRLVAQRLDLDRGELVGEPETVADMVSTGLNFQPSFSLSSDGRIAYRSGDLVQQELVWMDRSGKAIGKLTADPRDAIAPAISPDGRRLALDRTVEGNRDVWLLDLSRGGITRVTFDPATEGFPVWSANGTQIVFESSRKGSFDIYVKSANGAGTEQPLLELPGNQWPMDASRDGKFLLYHDGANAGDLMALPLIGDRRPIPVVTTPFTERTGAFSPNARWVAYDTNESGRFEVFVQPFPNATGKWQVSTAGGTHPRWSADGKELYFVSAGRLMMSSVRDSTSFEVSVPVPLFQARLSVEGAAGAKAPYAVSPDGRFLVNQVLEAATTAPITILLNWTPKHK